MTTLLHKHCFRAMASPCEVVIGGLPPAQAQALAERVQAEVVRIEQKYSRYRSDSIVSCLNAAAGREAVTVDSETLRLLETADKLYHASSGLFDITAGVLRRVWHFNEPRLPAPAAIAEVLPLIDWLAVERHGNGVRLAHSGMELDFGGFGKEYAADCGAQILLHAGVTSGYVNLGGDVRVLGPKPGGEPWQFGIAHPRQRGVIATLPVMQGALATSGDYERYFELSGQRYCHILDPRTGMPVQYWQSVSVLAPNTLLAGGFCTLAMLYQQDGLEFLRQAGLPFLAIDHAGNHWQHDADSPTPLRHAS